LTRRTRTPVVRLLDHDGREIGIVRTEEAMRMAEERGLEVVEIESEADPPVCRLMEFGKFKYEFKKKERAARRAQAQATVKQVTLTPQTSPRDLEQKLDQLRQFLRQRHDCLVTVVFQGREGAHQQNGHAMLDRVASALELVATVKATEQGFDDRMAILLTPRVRRSQKPARPR
jgi:translation initiation factor IF-3